MTSLDLTDFDPEIQYLLRHYGYDHDENSGLEEDINYISEKYSDRVASTEETKPQSSAEQFLKEQKVYFEMVSQGMEPDPVTKEYYENMVEETLAAFTIEDVKAKSKLADKVASSITSGSSPLFNRVPPESSNLVNPTPARSNLEYGVRTERTDPRNTYQIGKNFQPEKIPDMPRQNSKGSVLTLANIHPQKWPERIELWENDCINAIALNGIEGEENIMNYIMNLLGTVVHRYALEWKDRYPREWEQLTQIASNPKNVTTQIRQMLLGSDPYRGDPTLANKALKDLETLAITDIKYIPDYSTSFFYYASLAGKSFDPKVNSQYFKKIPDPLGSKIEEKWEEANGHQEVVGLAPRIFFTHGYLKDLCEKKQVDAQIRSYDFCKNIYVSGQFGGTSSRVATRQLRPAQNYRRGRAKTNHVKKFNRNKPTNFRKCKCFVCGEEGHFAKECRSKKVSKDRLAVYNSLDLDKNWDIVSAEDDERSQDSDVCSYTSEVAVPAGNELYKNLLAWEQNNPLGGNGFN